MPICKNCGCEFEITELRLLKHKNETSKYAEKDQRKKVHDLQLCSCCEMKANRPSMSIKEKLAVWKGEDESYKKSIDNILLDLPFESSTPSLS